jgi:hypothetical protein
LNQVPGPHSEAAYHNITDPMSEWAAWKRIEPTKILTQQFYPKCQSQLQPSQKKITGMASTTLQWLRLLGRGTHSVCDVFVVMTDEVFAEALSMSGS